MRPATRVVPRAILFAFLASCSSDSGQRERDAEAAGSLVHTQRTSTLQAGAPTLAVYSRNPYSGDENAIADGRRLYAWMNCLGCHGELGGGGIGPPLADADWIYGGEDAVIYQSIMQGRPNGMPTYEGKVTPGDAWKIAAFVRTLSADAERDAGQQGPTGQGVLEGPRK